MRETHVKNFVLSLETDHSWVRGEDDEELDGEGRDNGKIGGI